jgi:cytidine deaminase
MIRRNVVYINIVFYEANKYSTHAEKSAIQQIKNKSILKYCKVYIIKIKNNEIEQAQPCAMCCKLLKKYGVKKIVCL